jgi:hypothetical protein
LLEGYFFGEGVLSHRRNLSFAAIFATFAVIPFVFSHFEVDKLRGYTSNIIPFMQYGISTFG